MTSKVTGGIDVTITVKVGSDELMTWDAARLGKLTGGIAAIKEAAGQSDDNKRVVTPRRPRKPAGERRVMPPVLAAANRGHMPMLNGDEQFTQDPNVKVAGAPDGEE